MYDDVRSSENPGDTLLEFCQSTYEAAAIEGKWDRANLERQVEAARKAGSTDSVDVRSFVPKRNGEAGAERQNSGAARRGCNTEQGSKARKGGSRTAALQKRRP